MFLPILHKYTTPFITLHHQFFPLCSASLHYQYPVYIHRAVQEFEKMKESASSSPCAACKMQRKKCGENCILAPHFPQNNPQKFVLVHKVFGTGNVIKLLQDVAVEQREEAVNSMVFEARERLRDPVNGSSATINNLQRKVAELQAQLAKTQDELANIRAEHDNLLAIVTGCMSTDASPDHFFFTPSPDSYQTNPIYQFDTQDQLWETLWK